MMSIALGLVLSLMMEAPEDKSVFEKIVAGVTEKEIEFMKIFEIDDGDGTIDKKEFVILTVVRIGATAPELIKQIHSRFDILDRKHSGKIRYSDLVLGYEPPTQTRPRQDSFGDKIGNLLKKKPFSSTGGGVKSSSGYYLTSDLEMGTPSASLQTKPPSPMHFDKIDNANLALQLKLMARNSGRVSPRGATGQPESYDTRSDTSSAADSIIFGFQRSKMNLKAAGRYSCHCEDTEIDIIDYDESGSLMIYSDSQGRVSSEVDVAISKSWSVPILENGDDGANDVVVLNEIRKRTDSLMIEDEENKYEPTTSSPEAVVAAGLASEDSDIVHHYSGSGNDEESQMMVVDDLSFCSSMECASIEFENNLDNSSSNDDDDNSRRWDGGDVNNNKPPSSLGQKSRERLEYLNNDRAITSSQSCRIVSAPPIIDTNVKCKRRSMDDNPPSEVTEEVEDKKPNTLAARSKTLSGRRALSSVHSFQEIANSIQNKDVLDKIQRAKEVMEERRLHEESGDSSELSGVVRNSRKMMVLVRAVLKNPYFFCFAAWFAWLFVGTIFYTMHEGVSAAKGFYMSVSVGYGIFWVTLKGDNVSRIFTTMHFVVGIFAIALAMAIFARTLISVQKNWYTEAVSKRKFEEAQETEGYQDDVVTAVIYYWPKVKIYVYFWIWAFVGISFCMGTGQWDFVDSLHFSISAMSTGGFLNIDDDSPNWYFVFVALYVIVGVPVMAIACGLMAHQIANLGHTEQLEKKINAQVTEDELEMMTLLKIEDGDGSIDATEFTILILVRIGALNPDLIGVLYERFDDLDVKNEGMITYDDLQLKHNEGSSGGMKGMVNTGKIHTRLGYG